MRSSVIPPMPTLSSIVSSTTLTGSNLPARACVAPRKSKPERLDQPSSTVTKIHRSAKLATRAASFRYGGRHHSGIPGGIIPLCPGGFVGIGRLLLLQALAWPIDAQPRPRVARLALIAQRRHRSGPARLGGSQE